MRTLRTNTKKAVSHLRRDSVTVVLHVSMLLIERRSRDLTAEDLEQIPALKLTARERKACIIYIKRQTRGSQQEDTAAVSRRTRGTERRTLDEVDEAQASVL